MASFISALTCRRRGLFDGQPAPDDMGTVVRDSLLELMTTTLFVYSGTLSVMSSGAYLVSDGVGADSIDVAKLMPVSFAFGISISVLAYSTGHLTGGHMNPAVSLMMYLKRELSLKKMVCYWLCQFLGAMVGSSLLWGSLSATYNHNPSIGRPPLELGATTLNPAMSQGNGFLMELMGSFVFYFVVAQTALDGRGVAESYFPPLAIGLSLVVVHIGLIPFTGCGVNPARTFGPSMVTCMVSAEECDKVVQPWYWIYWAGPFSAAILVAEVTYWMRDTPPAADDTAKDDAKVAPKKGEGPNQETIESGNAPPEGAMEQEA